MSAVPQRPRDALEVVLTEPAGGDLGLSPSSTTDRSVSFWWVSGALLADPDGATNELRLAPTTAITSEWLSG